MPQSDQIGSDDRRDPGPVPEHPKASVSKTPIVVVLLVLLLLAAAGVGVVTLMWAQPEETPAAASSQEEDFRLDVPTLVRELAEDREGTKSRYVGRMIEFEVAEITVESRNQFQTVLLLPVEDKSVPASSFGIEFKGRFPFANPRNIFLKEARSGPIRLRVRGVVARIDQTDGADTVSTFVLDPAWAGRVE